MKKRIALFSPVLDDFREWHILTDIFASVLEEDYDLTLFSKAAGGEAIPFHEFTWRNLKQPYDLIIYNFSKGEDFTFMAPFLLVNPGLVILRAVSFAESIWRMHTLDGTEQDFVDEMAYCYGKEGILLGNLMWRGMWGEQLDRKFPMLKLAADSSLIVCGFEPWILEMVKRESAGDDCLLLPPPFICQPKKKSQPWSLLTFFTVNYPLQIDVILSSVREINAAGFKLRLTIVTDEENKMEVTRLIESIRLESVAQAFVPAVPAELDELFSSSHMLLFIEDPAAPVEGLPVMAASAAGCAAVLTDSLSRFGFPESAFPKFRFREKTKCLFEIIKNLLEKPEELERFSRNAREHFFPNQDILSSDNSNSRTLNPAFSAVFKNAVTSGIEKSKNHIYPIGYPDHLQRFRKRLLSSMKEKLSDFPASKDIDEAIEYVIGPDLKM
jgi:hypothetical protein